MKTSRGALAVIFFIVFIDLIGFGIVIPVLPLYAQHFGASPLVIGLLLASYSAMQSLCAPLLGRLSDRIGRRPVLLVSLIGTAAGFLLMGAARTLPLLFLGRIIDGATGGNLSTAQAYIADVTPEHQRSRGMGLIGAAFGLGFIVGPALGGVLSRFSMQAPFLFAAGLALTNAAALWFFLPESLPPQARGHARSKLALRELYAGPNGDQLKLAMATYFVATVAFSLLTATYPLFTERRFGYGAEQNGYIFAFQGLLGAVLQGMMLGWLVKRFKEKPLIIAGALVLSAGMWLLPSSATIAMLLATTAVTGLGHGLLAAPLNGIASKAVDERAQGRAMGAMQSAASLARIVGPVLGGALLHADAAGSTSQFGRTPYWAGACIMMLALALSANIKEIRADAT
jgi:DHA1 family tetracycline resistance protein-like MFS transporter